eukprot:366334-Chlamydomonas_euryale.AAC.6
MSGKSEQRQHCEHVPRRLESGGRRQKRLTPHSPCNRQLPLGNVGARERSQGWLSGWLVDCLSGCLAVWLAGCLAGWLVGCLAGWLAGCACWLAGRLCLLMGWLGGRCTNGSEACTKHALRVSTQPGVCLNDSTRTWQTCGELGCASCTTCLPACGVYAQHANLVAGFCTTLFPGCCSRVLGLCALTADWSILTIRLDACTLMKVTCLPACMHACRPSTSLAVCLPALLYPSLLSEHEDPAASRP